MDIQIDNSRPFTVANVSGVLDVLGIEKFTETLQEHACGEEARLAIDLSQLKMIDSSGLSAMISLATRARLTSGQVVLVAPSPFVSGILEVTHLDHWFDVCDNLDDAARRLGLE